MCEFTLYIFPLFSCLDSDMLHVCFMLLHDLETQTLNTIKEVVVVVVFVVRAAAIAATVAWEILRSPYPLCFF